MGLLISAAVLLFGFGAAYVASEVGHWPAKDAGLLEELSQRGFDKRTFKFSVRHGGTLESAQAPVPAEAAA